MFITCAIFIIIKIFFVIPQWQQTAGIVGGLDIRPLLTDWVGFLLFALMGGIIGPMATTISAFIIYCGTTFTGEKNFDPLAKDKQGGFGSLGTLGMWSTFMAAFTPGIAIPFLFLDTKPEIMTSGGLLFFLIICVNLFFFIPIYYVHKAMKKSRKLQIQKLEKNYRPKLGEFLEKVENGKTTELTETASMLALKGFYDDVTMKSDWLVNPLTILEVITGVLIPILGHILTLLTLS